MLSTEQFGFNAFWWEKLWEDDEIKRCASSLSRIGYKAVEFKLDSFNPSKSMKDEFARAVRIAREEGLEVSNFVILRDVADSKNRDKGIADVKRCIQAVSGAGVNKLNLITGGVPNGVSLDEKKWWLPKKPLLAMAWDNILGAFEQFLKLAEKEKVYLVVEACVGQIVHDYYSTLELMRHFDSEYLCLTLDPSHYQLYRNDIPWAIRQWKDKIKHVHVKDTVGVPGEFGVDFLFPILGEGAINWNEFFRALDEIEYKGYLSVEFESFKYMDEVLGNNPSKAAEISMESLQKLWRQHKEMR